MFFNMNKVDWKDTYDTFNGFFHNFIIIFADK